MLCSFGQMAHRVGDYLKQDPLKLRFTSSNPQSGTPKAIIKRSLNQSVADITGTNYYSQHPNVIVYYELLDISIIELETKKSLKLFWTGRNNKEEVSDMPVIEFSPDAPQGVHSFLLPKTHTYEQVAERLLSDVKLQPGGSGKIRIFDISSSGRSQREYTSSEMIGNLTDPAELFAEVSTGKFLATARLMVCAGNTYGRTQRTRRQQGCEPLPLR